MTGKDSMARYLAFSAVAELGPAGVKHLHFVVEEVDKTYPDVDSVLLDALVAVRNPEALKKLQELADSKIWSCQTRAKAALERAQTAAAKEGE